MTTRSRRPPAPASLGEAGRSLWRSVTSAYDLAPAEMLLLSRACRTADVLTAIDAALADDGVVVEGSMGQPRAHPLLMAKAQQEQTLDVLIRGMALPFPDEDTGRRRTPSAAAAAQARWRSERGSVA